jgi:dethiobiotin synthetase
MQTVTRREYFVTGTDTGVGKTLVAAGLLLAAGRRELRTVGIKPVAAGVKRRPGPDGETLVNEDALVLQGTATLHLDYELVNPYALEEPVAPHVAAAKSGIALDVAGLVLHFERLRELDFELMIVEGAGGWLVPLNDNETLADLCAALKMPVILVVGMHLGCLNHALLTAAAMAGAGVRMAGWVANCLQADMPAFQENLQTLRDRLPAPCLGVLPFLGPGLIEEDVEGILDLDILLS